MDLWDRLCDAFNARAAPRVGFPLTLQIAGRTPFPHSSLKLPQLLFVRILIQITNSS